MNKLQIQVLETKPAVVSFNYDEISKHLDEILKKYEGIVVTEDTVKDGKKVIADLRKGQKSLDEFRKKTKKELTAPVTEFENQCKELGKKFDAAINPIVEQAEQFEEKRKEEKKIEIQKVIKEVCELKGIESLPLEDSYLNKSANLKAIKTDLIKVADEIILTAENHKKNVELIKSKVEFLNLKYSFYVDYKPYTELLDYEDVTKIINTIEVYFETLNLERVKAKPTIPVTKSINKPPIDEEIFVDVYEIEGTEAQLNAIEDFLNINGYKWSIKE
ncbi:DUF1351 domain-containing protein [Clostridium tetani]|uniref:DUF1351 domain-containing protein n=1 Tax=Clostridium tetani TaxID=1513 RepID=UPI00100A3880|nr:DUF1351 domain-containing protein [Clostridium tetani]RXM68380.1 hypothetical protein DP139_12435 [Clostridium tetani]